MYLSDLNSIAASHLKKKMTAAFLHIFEKNIMLTNIFIVFIVFLNIKSQ
jgi:hypothetical protein